MRTERYVDCGHYLALYARLVRSPLFRRSEGLLRTSFLIAWDNWYFSKYPFIR